MSWRANDTKSHTSEIELSEQITHNSCDLPQRQQQRRNIRYANIGQRMRSNKRFLRS